MRTRAIATLSALGVIAGGTLLWGGAAEATGTGVSVGGFTADDVISLSLGAVNEVGYQPAGSSTPSTAQTVSPGCPGSLGSSPQYLAVSPSGGSLGIVDNGIGVQGRKDGNGSPCGRADGTSQFLTLTPGSSLAGAKWVRAELDVELKFDARLDVTALLGNTQQFTSTFVPNNGSDSGPDSGDGDNFRIIVAQSGKLFDKVILRINSATPGGAFALEGGADGTAAGPLGESIGSNASVFQVVDGTLNCGQSDTADPSAGVGTSSSLLRLGGATNTVNPDGSACSPIPFRFDVTSADNVLFQKDLTGQTSARFLWTLSWDPEVAAYPLTEATSIDYLLGAGPETIQWCDFPSPAPAGSTAYTTKSGRVVSPALPAGLDADADLAGQQGWCLVEQYSSIATGGKTQVNEVLYGTGDPKTFR